MGLIDRYRRFSELTDEEVRADFKAKADEQRSRELEKVGLLDLTRSTADELPHPAVAAAISFAAKRALNLEPDPQSSELRDLLASHAGLPAGRVLIGHGASGLLAAVAAAVSGPDDQVLVPWPSYHRHPAIAGAGGAQAVPLHGARDAESIAAAVAEAGPSPLLILTNPNDPDGHLMAPSELSRLRHLLPDQTLLAVDEALAHYAGEEYLTAMDDLVADTEGLIIVRSFSKAWGLAGLRTGVLMGGPNLDELFARLHPLTGVPAPSEAGCLAALSEARDQMLVRVASVKRERERIGALLKGSTVDVASGGSANLIWARIPGLTADQLTARMRTSGVIVRNGAVIGSPDNICAAIRGDQAATDRLADGLIAAAAAVS